MQLHVQETSAIARWYDDEQGENAYEDRKPYSAVCSMMFMGDKKVYIYGLQGNLTREMTRDLARELLRRGFEEFTMERQGTYVTHRLDKFLQ
jgi:predicted alpha/beta-fold hydrolase